MRLHVLELDTLDHDIYHDPEYHELMMETEKLWSLKHQKLRSTILSPGGSRGIRRRKPCR